MDTCSVVFFVEIFQVFIGRSERNARTELSGWVDVSQLTHPWERVRHVRFPVEDLETNFGFGRWAAELRKKVGKKGLSGRVLRASGWSFGSRCMCGIQVERIRESRTVWRC